MDRIKKIIKLFLIVLIFIPNCDIKADNDYDINNYSGGYGDAGYQSACITEEDKNMTGCAGYAAPFKIRFGLFKANESKRGFELVEGTKVVEMRQTRDNKTYESTPDYAYTKYKVGNTSNYESVYFSNYNNQIIYSGMLTDDAGTHKKQEVLTTNNAAVKREGYTSEITYGTNLGLSEGFIENFEHAVVNRNQMERYIMSLEKKNQVPNTNTYVSFIDFFLKVCGLSESWEADSETKKKIISGEYYIIAEPVYEMSVYYKDGWHMIEGTTGQLLRWSHYNNDDSFWVAYDTDTAYNFMCNFTDTTVRAFQGYNTEKTDLCMSKLNFEWYNGNSNRAYYFKNYFYNITSSTVYARNVYSLKRYQEELKKKYVCNYNISKCDNNNFIFSSKLSLDYIEEETSSENSNGTNTKISKITDSITSKEDLYNCVYPKNIDAESLKKYVYTVGVDGKELWCYDDVTYNFTELAKLQDKTYASNSYAEIPSGKLTVNRTCYTKTNEVSDADLTNLFVNDSVGKYQDEFNFNFNNKTYKFVRDTNKGITYKDTNNKYDIEKYGIDRYNNFDYAIYTAEFYYDYVIKDSYDTETLKNNNSFMNTNSVEFIKEFKNSKAIKLGSIYSKQENIVNKIDTNMNDAYGLSNKMVNELNKSTIDFQMESENTKKGKRKVESELVSYGITENINQTCEFTTNMEPTIGWDNKIQFRVISLSNPFPGRDGTSRLAGENWVNETENNVYNYIEKNRNVNSEEVYQKEPLYKLTLDASSMIKIREYNKTHSYSEPDITCEAGTGRMCVSNFIRKAYYIKELDGTCAIQTPKEITKTNKSIKNFIDNCGKNPNCVATFSSIKDSLDLNHDGKVTKDDYLTADFYTCADKTYMSGG